LTESTLNGQTAVVTGAESGIGRETAIVLAEQGISVFGGDLRLSDENTERFRQLSIRRRKCDVRRESNLRDLIDAAVSETGRIDILVNNAGVGMVKPIVDVSEAD
jgi:NAD(P)-dependent dehydrogenase (short-subunit alcohol dehydrogenase family)